MVTRPGCGTVHAEQRGRRTIVTLYVDGILTVSRWLAVSDQVSHARIFYGRFLSSRGKEQEFENVCVCSSADECEKC